MPETNITRRRLIGFASALAAGQLSIVSRGAAASANAEYDYIVVGAGSAGAVVASRLAQASQGDIVALEAGSQPRSDLINDPLRWFSLLSTGAVWPQTTQPQEALGGKQLFAAHGRVVGGSSTINAMIHHHPIAADIDRWAVPGWGWNDIAAFLESTETYLDGPARGRGTSGPIGVTTLPDPPPLAAAFFEAAEATGRGVTGDINRGRKLGAALNQIAIRHERRQHTGLTFLKPALARPNLDLLTDAHVESLIMTGKRCSGVRLRQNGKRLELRACQGVILCAGAIHTPKLLMLSGIGPAEVLRKNGIKVLVDSRSVGANLHDHLLISGNNYATASEIEHSRYHGSVAVLYEASGLHDGHRDLLLNLSTNAQVLAPLTSAPNGFKSTFSFMRPFSRGRVSLRSADPNVLPMVDHRILHDERDWQGTLAALALSRELLQAKPFDRFNGRELNPTNNAPESLRQMIIDGATLFGHSVGTCRMGIDDGAVVDPHLRVNGVDNLYVVDASVIPSIPSCPTNPLVVAIAARFANELSTAANARNSDTHSSASP